MQSYRDVFDAHTATALEYATAVQDEQTSCYSDLMQIHAAAETQWRSACETYQQEVRAAAAGDDAAQRAATAYHNLQREYGRIQSEYVKAGEERYGRMAQALRTQGATARVKALDGWIAYLQKARDAAAAGTTDADTSGS
jgi:hypothetical protein